MCQVKEEATWTIIVAVIVGITAETMVSVLPGILTTAIVTDVLRIIAITIAGTIQGITVTIIV